MSTETLSTSISTGIVLTAAGRYTSPFTVTSDGTISATGNDVSSSLTYASLLNFGRLDGGIDFIKSGKVTNNGFIAYVSISAADGFIGNTGTIDTPNFGALSGFAVVLGGAATTVENSGLISSRNHGIKLPQGGFVLNNGSLSEIYGGLGGIGVSGGTGTVVNYGTIASDFSSTVYFYNAGVTGTVINAGTSAKIEGFGSSEYAVDFQSANGTVENNGTITDTNGIGLLGGTITNLDTSAVIYGNVRAVTGNEFYTKIINQGTLIGQVEIRAAGNVSNSGSVSSAQYMYLRSGTVSNQGRIVATTNYGIVFKTGSGTVTNSGTIWGGLGAIDFEGTVGNDRLIVDPGAYFYGGVAAAGTLNTIELAAGRGTLGNLGAAYTGFQSIEFDPGAAWTLDGTSRGLAGDTITGFTRYDTIDATDLGFVSPAILTLGSADTLAVRQGAETLNLTFAGAEPGAVFTLRSDGAEGTMITSDIACFCAGTCIATPGGEARVEDLRIGDAVETLGAGPQRIKWIGRRGYDGRFIADHHLALPVRIRAGAVADRVPARDLWVSPGHAVMVDGLLIPAWRLINDRSVAQAVEVERVEYYHIELETHEVIFAEGCPVESFLDDDCRGQFQNAAEFALLYPAARRVVGQPRTEEGFALEAARRRLARRAGVEARQWPMGALRGVVDGLRDGCVFGWAQDEWNVEEPVVLEVWAGGVKLGEALANGYRADLRAAGLGSGCHAFQVALPEGVGQVEVRRAADQAVLKWAVPGGEAVSATIGGLRAAA